jgi:hypothetical protein
VNAAPLASFVHPTMSLPVHMLAETLQVVTLHRPAHEPSGPCLAYGIVCFMSEYTWVSALVVIVDRTGGHLLPC